MASQQRTPRDELLAQQAVLAEFGELALRTDDLDLILNEACHNAFLAEQARQLHGRLKPYRRLQLRARSRVASSLAEHQAIVEAVLAGDGGKAERLLKDHVLIQGERLTDFIASLDPAAVA
jgi:DNA-binding GntR family transcriptional regulator